MSVYGPGDRPPGTATKKTKAKVKGKAAAPKYKPTPTPDQAQGRPSEPVKVTVRKRSGDTIKRETHTLPNVAAAQAHLDRLAEGKKLRAHARGDDRDTRRSAHVKVVVVPKPGETFEAAQRNAPAEQKRYEQRIKDADAVNRVRIRAKLRARRREDERDIQLAGVAHSSDRGRRQFSKGIVREGTKVDHEIVRKAGPEKEQFAGELVKAKQSGQDNPVFREALTREADKRARARKAAEGDPGDVLGNAVREVKDTVTSLPTAASELAKVGAEQLDTSGKVDKPHTKAFVKGLSEQTVPGRLLHGDVRGAARLAATRPVSTALTVAAGTGAAVKGAEATATAAKAVKAGARAGDLPAAVRKARAVKRARPNARVDLKPTASSKAKADADRKAAAAGEHRRGDVATRAQTYSDQPAVRAVQKARENRRAAKGQDPFQARGRKAKRITKQDAKRRVDQQQAAGHVRSAEVNAAVDDDLAAQHGTKAAVARKKVTIVERRALRGHGKKAEVRRHAFALAQSGIVDTRSPEAIARTLREHEEAHRVSLRDDDHDDASRAQTQKNLERVKEMRRQHDAGASPFDDQLVQAARQRRAVSEGQDRRRAKRLKGGTARAEGRKAKAVRLGRSETPQAPVRPSANAKGPVPDHARVEAPAEPKSMQFKTPTHELTHGMEAAKHTIRQLDDDLANLAVRRKTAIRSAKTNADRKAVLDKYERARYAITERQARIQTKVDSLQQRVTKRREHLAKHGAVERTVAGERVTVPHNDVDAPIVREHVTALQKHDRLDALHKRRDNITTEIARVEGARRKHAAEPATAALRADYKQRFGVDAPADAHARNRELARLRALEDEKPDKALRARLKALQSLHDAEDKHQSMQRRREGRLGHRGRELQQVENEIRGLEASLQPREIHQAKLDEARARQQERHTPKPEKERLTVRQLQRQHLRRQIDDEHAGESMHGDKPRPTQDLEADLADLAVKGEKSTPAGAGPKRGEQTSGSTDEGEPAGYVPIQRELDGDPDRRLGAHDIDGLLTRKSLLSEDWGSYDPRAAQGRLERGINADALRREVLAQAHNGKTDLTLKRAGEVADQLNRESPIKWATVATKDGDDTYAVLPKVLADRWKAVSREKRLPGKALDIANQRFVRAVLPLSAMWHAGNAVDMMTRLALSGARPGDAALAHQLRKTVGQADEEWARLAIDSVGGAHFRGQSVRDPASIARHIPVLDDAIDQLFAVGRGVEAKAARSAQGTALRQQAKALGEYSHDVETMVGRWRERPELVDDFQRRTLEILGDYVHHPLVGSHDLRVIAPFVQWLKASLKFTFQTLPTKHPIRTALMFNLAAATEEQRRLVGASQYITAQQAKEMGLPAPRKGFLAGGLALGDGSIMPTSGLTSMSAAGSLLDDPVDYMGRILVPWADRPAGRALASRDSATEYGMRSVRKLVEGASAADAVKPGAGRDAGEPGSQRALGEAGSGLVDAFVPGAHQVAVVRRGGRRPGVHTTTINSTVYGSAETKDGKRKDGSTGKTYGPTAALLGFTPQRDFPTPASQRDVETSSSGRYVKVKALDGSTYRLDTRTGRPVQKVRAKQR